MAARRMVPTRFFKDPDIMSLSSKDSQLILIGLILGADDEGREVAHPGLLGREMDYPPEQVEAALEELAANDLLVLYHVGRHRYYSLTRWRQWQTLGTKFTPSKHPAPPEPEHDAETVPVGGSPEHTQTVPVGSGDFRGFSGTFGENPAQFSSDESNVIQYSGGEENDLLHETDDRLPSNVVAFPASPPTGTGTTSTDGDVETITFQVAQVLGVPVTDALRRLMAEYLPVPALSLLGEADAAREWIEDRTRNHTGKHLTPAFFRRWLRRECEDAQRRQQAQRESLAAASGQTGAAPPFQGHDPGRKLPPSLMHLADQFPASQRPPNDGASSPQNTVRAKEAHNA